MNICCVDLWYPMGLCLIFFLIEVLYFFLIEVYQVPSSWKLIGYILFIFWKSNTLSLFLESIFQILALPAVLKDFTQVLQLADKPYIHTSNLQQTTELFSNYQYVLNHFAQNWWWELIFIIYACRKIYIFISL